MAPKDLEEILSSVGEGRRDFIRRVLTGAAFASPIVSSVSMASHSLVGTRQVGMGCVSSPQFGPPLFAPVGPITLPVGTGLCCEKAIHAIRDISAQLVLGMERQADLLSASAAARAELTEHLASALELVSQAISTGGANCRKEKQPYRQAIRKIQLYKDALPTLNLNTAELLADADAAMVALQEIIDGTC